MSEENNNTKKEEEEVELPKFRSVKKGVNIRKRKVDEAELGNEDVSTSNADDNKFEGSEIIEALKVQQKMRSRPKGVGSMPKFQKKESTEKVEEYGLIGGAQPQKNDDDEEKKKVVLGSTFTAQKNISEVDAQMNKFIEEKMAERRKLNADFKDTDKNNIVSAVSKEESEKKVNDELYRIPDHLRVVPKKVDKKDNESDTMDKYLTGIQEVELSVDAKIRNIEETERAKRELQKKSLAHNPFLSGVGSSNRQGANGVHRFGALGRNEYGNIQKSTDDLAVDRFRKSYLRRFSK
eukprot:c21370_g1_i2.p1 GENE.c21370_g1_i2~~c21370_g1_i2.p1  ORF type:complete len:293 (-),score=132.47 c21370_g1_i2:12-890(-)